MKSIGPYVDPDAAAAVRPVLRAGKSRFRLLVVVCPNNHQLCEVLQTAAGPVVMGRAWGGIPRRRGAVVCRNLDRLGEQPGEPVFECKCRRRQVPAAWLIERVDTPARRAVWPD